MTKSQIAEWILSQVLPPDRVTSIVGDWLEDTPKRGNLWFWSCVIRTAISHLWNDLTQRPASLLSLALRSCLFSLAVYMTGTIALRQLIYLFVVQLQAHSGPHTRTIFWFLSGLAGWASTATYGAIAGRWTARRNGGAKLTACVVCCVTNLIFSRAIFLAFLDQFPGSSLSNALAKHAASTQWIVAELIFEAAFVAGFIRLRQPARRLAK